MSQQVEYVFLEPLDVMQVRGNRSFGDPGDHGAAQMPPWPSLAAGALRSRMLADAGVKPGDLRDGIRHERLGPVLGSYAEPGSFRLSALLLARAWGAEAVYPCPADLFIGDGPAAHLLRPCRTGLASSYGLAQIPALAVGEQGKPVSRWLTAAGWRRYLAGSAPRGEELIEQKDLWALDARVGVGLDAERRAAAQGKLFSSEAVAFRAGVGLLAGVSGAAGQLPGGGSVRLGGDGRAAGVRAAVMAPDDQCAAVAASGRGRMICTSAALFTDGWRPPGRLGAAVVAAAVPRHQVVSGWDLLEWRPKPAVRVAPAGSVYWFEGLKMDAAELRRIEVEGLWPEGPLAREQKQRRAEGWNAVRFAQWGGEKE